jgi:hypothetical protein
MTYSKTHQKFSERLEQPDVLTDPEKYLGPNYQDVLNFWIYLDTLSAEEKNEISVRYWALDLKARESAWIASRNVAIEVVGWGFRCEAWDAAYDVTEMCIFGDATEELIAHHKLLEQNKTPLSLQYCTKS